MKCTNCGYETQPGARFCVQCGTTLPPEPANVAAPAAATAGVGAPVPAAAAVAKPATAPSPNATIPPRPAAAIPPAPAAATATAAGGAATKGASVAATGGRPKLGMIAAMLALVAVLGIGGFVAYHVSQSGEPKDTSGANDSAKPVDAGATPGTAGGATDVSTSSAQQPAALDAAAPEAANDQSGTSGSAADATKAAPGQAGGAATLKANAPASKSARTAPPQPPAAKAGTTEVAPAAQAPVARTPAPAPAASPQPDRWQQMREAMAKCKREDFFRRVGCEQSVGLQYCEGYWGKVPQCPGLPRDSSR